MKLGFLSLLTIIFVIAKLVHVINWSWWLVFAPIWIGIPALLLLAFVGLILLMWAES